MKKISVILASVAKAAARSAAGSASDWGLFQPKEPINIKVKKFTSQINTSHTAFQDFVRKTFRENDLKIDDRFKSVDEKFDLMRLENGKYSKDLLAKSNQISLDWEKVANIRDEIYGRYSRVGFNKRSG